MCFDTRVTGRTSPCKKYGNGSPFRRTAITKVRIRVSWVRVRFRIRVRVQVGVRFSDTIRNDGLLEWQTGIKKYCQNNPENFTFGDRPYLK